MEIRVYERMSVRSSLSSIQKIMSHNGGNDEFSSFVPGNAVKYYCSIPVIKEQGFMRIKVLHSR